MFTIPVRLRKLCVLGSISAVLYMLTALVFWTDAVFSQSDLIEVLLNLNVGLLTALYFAGIWTVRDSSTRIIVVFAIVFALLGFVAGPFDSTDVFFYIAQGWHQSHYNGNPYSNVLRDIPSGDQDPMIASRWMALNRNPWLDEPMPYGFGFALVTRTVAMLGGGNWFVTLILFNLINLIAHVTMSWLLWKTAALIPGVDPKLVLYLYTWSPLVVLQYLANVHNDIIMASLIVLAFYLLLKGRAAWALPALVGAGLVKHVAFALTPFALIFLLRRFGWRVAVNAALISVLLAAGASLPYVWDFGSFKLQQVAVQLTESTGSLHSFMTFTYRAIARLVSSDPVHLGAFARSTGLLLWGVVAIITIYQFRRAWSGKRSSPYDIAARWTSILFAVIFVGSSQFYIWYIGMVFPMALLTAGRNRLSDVVVLLSGTHMLFNFLHGKAIGHFLLATAIPLLLLFFWWGRCLPVVKPGDGSIPSQQLSGNGHRKLLTS